MKNKTIKKCVCVSLIGLIAFYVSYQIYAFAFPETKTETVYKKQVFESIDTNAYIIRDEREISDNGDGYANFVLTDGEKVGKNGVIAQVYQTEEQGLLKKKVKDLENEIERLKNLESFGIALSTSPSSIERQSYQELNNLLKSVNNDDYQKLKKSRNKILYLLNQRQIATNKICDFSDKINSLKQEIDNIKVQDDKETRTILADEAGYFVGKTDGFEDEFNYNNVLNITPSQVKDLINNNTPKKKVSAKLVKNAVWYVVCNVQKDEALNFYTDQWVDLSMPFVSADGIKAKVVAINQSDKNSNAAIVFQCNYIDKNTLTIRKGPIKINIAEYNGILVSKNSIHEKNIVADNETGDEKTVKGVYIKIGKQIFFKEVDIIFSSNDYVLCAFSLDKSKSNPYDTIKEYDEVVVKGKGLYDGKVVR